MLLLKFYVFIAMFITVIVIDTIIETITIILLLTNQFQS